MPMMAHWIRSDWVPISMRMPAHFLSLIRTSLGSLMRRGAPVPLQAPMARTTPRAAARVRSSARPTSEAGKQR